MPKPIIVGAVLYDPKVSVIWDIIREFFEENHCPIDVVFYTNYEQQSEALMQGHIAIAWNSPLAETLNGAEPGELIEFEAGGRTEMIEVVGVAAG